MPFVAFKIFEKKSTFRGNSSLKKYFKNVYFEVP